MQQLAAGNCAQHGRVHIAGKVAVMSLKRPRSNRNSAGFLLASSGLQSDPCFASPSPGGLGGA
eukprot:3799968-Rhodomonas_salina.1